MPLSASLPETSATAPAANQTRSELLAGLSSEVRYELRQTAADELEVEWISNPLAPLTGYTLEELDGTDLWHSVVHSDDRAAIEAHLDRLRSGEEDECEFRIIGADGVVRWVQNRARSLPFTDGSRRIVGIARDVSRRHRAERTWRQADEMHRLTLAHLSETLFITDGQGRFTYVAPNVHVILGYTPAEVYAFESIEALIGPRFAPEGELFGAGEQQGIVCEVQHHDGSQRTLEFDLTQVSAPRGTHLFTCRDITTRRQAQQQFERLLDFVSDAILFIDQEGSIRLVNERAGHTFGFATDELIGQPVDRLLAAPYRKRLQILHNTYFKAPSLRPAAKQMQVEAQRSDGSPFEAEITMTPIRVDGQLLVAAGIRDVSVRQTAVKKANQSEAQLRALFENTLDALLLTNNHGVYVDANPAACDLLGYEREELVGRSVSDIVVANDEERIGELWTRFLEDGRQSGHIQLQRHDGSRFTADFHAMAHLLPGIHLSVLREIHLNEKDEHYRRRLADIVDSSSDAIIGAAIDGTITSWNAAAEHLLGYAEEEVLGEPVEQIVPEARRAKMTALRQKADQQEIPRLDFELLRKDGKMLPVSLKISSLTDSEGTIFGISMIARDISMRKRFVREMISAKKEAERMNRLKAAFLTNMSHEIRTPLTSIIGFADVIDAQVSDELREFTSYIRMNSERLLDTLDAVFELSQIESGTYEYLPTVLPLDEEVDEVLEQLAPRAEMGGLDLTREESDEEVHVECDPVALDRILYHLLDNAIKFTEGGAVSVRTGQRGRYAFVEVQDTGVGVREEFLPRIFNAFEQESTGDSRTFEGSGLGLAIVEKLVDMMGGMIEVDSEHGSGSTFTIRLPLVEQDAGAGTGDEPADEATTEAAPPTGRIPDAPDAAVQTPPTAEEQPADEKPESEPQATEESETSAERDDTQPARLLAVEDNQMTRTMIDIMLRDRYEVTLAANAEEALTKARSEPFDLVLLDINLGEQQNGVEVLHALRREERYAQVPMVACTAYALPGDRERFLQAGFQGYIGKPVKKAALLETIEEALQTGVERSAPTPSASSSRTEIQLPPLPDTLPRVVQLLSENEGGADVEQLTEILEHDPVVASWVLRQVNSAAYGLRQHVDSIDRAVTLLGFDPVCNLVLVEVLRKTFSDVSSEPMRDVYEHLLQISIATGFFAKELTETLNTENHEMAFTAGVLHQVGRLVLLSSEADEYASLWRFESDRGGVRLVAPPTSQEVRAFGTDHMNVGAKVAKQWNLSKIIATTLRYYHRPQRVHDRQLRLLVLATTVSQRAARRLFNPHDPERELTSEDFGRHLGDLAALSNRSAERLLARLNDHADEVRDFVGAAFPS